MTPDPRAPMTPEQESWLKANYQHEIDMIALASMQKWMAWCVDQAAERKAA